MFNNLRYREYCEAYASDIPLFHQPWWLDAVAGRDQWNGLVSGATFASKPSILPIYSTSKWFFSKIHKPTLTTYQGPIWAGYGMLHPLEQMRVVSKTWPDLIKQIPPTTSFRHTIFPDFQYAYPFHEAGFELGIRYTYTIDLNQPIESIFKNFRRDVKRKLNKTLDNYQIVESSDLSLFFPLLNNVYQRQNQPTPFSYAFLEHLFLSAHEQAQVKLFLLQGSARHTLGGVLLFYDHQRVYLLASGLNEEGRKTGTFQQLIWHTLQYFSTSKQVFDFCGSMMPNIADSNQSMGGLAHTYLEVSKRKGMAKLLGV